MPSLPALLDLWRSPFPTGNIDYTPEKLIETVHDFMHTDLTMHEQSKAPGALGGHTLQLHVGKSDNELQAILANNPEKVHASTFYHDKAFAEAVIAKAILDNLHRVYNWYHRVDDPAGSPTGDGGGKKKFFYFKSATTFPVGFGYERTQAFSGNSFQLTKHEYSCIFVKLKRGSINGRDEFIVTAFPCPLTPEAS